MGLEFKAYGFELIGTYVNTHTPVAVKCRECEKPLPIRMNNLREAQKRGTRGCSNCRRMTDEQVRKILAQAGLRKVGPFLSTRVPVDCICTRCNQPYRARVSHINHRLQRGLRVWGCRSCALKAIRVVELTEQEAHEEFYELGVKDVKGWVNAGTAVEGRCVQCDRRTRPRLTVIRRSSIGVACASCNGRGFWSIPSLRKDSQLAEAPAFIYVYEFTDLDGTLFHKVGITRDSNGWSSRLDEHERFEGELIHLASATRIVCRMAELLILRHVGPHAYEPSEDRLAAGHSECYLPQEAIDLESWLKIATAKLEEYA
jgi:protein-arginine kinase activator protein McsA